MDYRFSDTMRHFKSSAVRDILKLTQGREIVSFAGGLPAEELFPVEAVRAAFERVLAHGNRALQYGITEGYTPLREAIAERMRRKNVTATADDMILTTGSQQAIDLLARVFLDPGDVVLVQQPTYLAALQVFQSRSANVVSVAGDESGMDPDDLAAKLKAYKPKLLYVSPTFANPTGYVWSIERREALVRLCREHGVVVIEDDPYGELQYGSDEHYPLLISLDKHPHGSAVVYTSTFSKTVAPAFRTGWTIADPTIIREMAKAKQAADLHSSPLDQQALYELLAHYDLDAHIALIRRDYEQRMRLLDGLLREIRTPLRWIEPKGGMFLWVELPEGWHSEELLRYAVKEGAAFVPGVAFYAGEPKTNTIRMNFTHADEATMRLGMARFATALEKYEAAFASGIASRSGR